MIQKTLLEMVQDILVDLNGDEVNTIGDTEEAEQIANIISKTYLALMSNSEWPHQRRVINLIPYSDNTYPTYLRLPDNVKRLLFVNYDKSDKDDTRKFYKEMQYLELDKFLMKLNKRDSSSANVSVIEDPSGVEFLIQTNKSPEYYTTTDDTTLIFDSYDSEVDDTIQQTKTQAWAYIIPEFRKEDGFIPDLPPDLFSLLLEEATSKVQFKLGERADTKSEQESSRQRRWASRKAFRVSPKNLNRDYGRKIR